MMDNRASGRLWAFGAEIVWLAAVAGGTFRLSTARLVTTGDSLARNRRRPSRPDPTTAHGPGASAKPERLRAGGRLRAGRGQVETPLR